ncbi:MAG TPA: 2,3-dihydroxybiphenyl 1,2-dioxygenase, partial [Pseudomonadales bacterium]
MNEASVACLGYLEIGVSSLSDWQDYAENVLGVTCIRSGDAIDLRYDAACWRIHLVETGEDDIRCAGFEVSSVADLNAIRARLEGQGVTVTDASADQARARGVDQLLLCADPFGLSVELYVGDRSVTEPFVSPRNVSGFVTGEQGLGHMVLTAADSKQAEVFYMQGLG